MRDLEVDTRVEAAGHLIDERAGGEQLGEAVGETGEIVLVPGNHDAYTREDGWRRALSRHTGPNQASEIKSA